MSVVYLDTSALVKLLSAEPESAALRSALQQWRNRTSSELTVVELLRAVRRLDVALERPALATLSGLALIPQDRTILAAAGRLDPPALRSLDAVHLATALSLTPDIDAFVTYDRRLHEAARAYDLPVHSPS